VHHRAGVPLFHYEKVLFSGPYSMNPPHEWDFEFIFPQRCEATGPDLVKSLSRMFEENKHQPLPASFSYTTDNFFGPDMDAFIRYELQAALVTPPGSRGSTEVTKLLTFKTHRYEQNPDSKLFFASQTSVVQSLYLSPEYDKRDLTFKEKLKAGIKSNKLAKAQYSLKALLPTVGVIGQRIPLAFGVTHDKNSTTTLSTLPIFLRNFKVQLGSRTTTRCKSDHFWSSDDVNDSDQTELMLSEQRVMIIWLYFRVLRRRIVPNNKFLQFCIICHVKESPVARFQFKS
ncbi:MAG: hypothetical protein L6R40_008745, partial [Gallowayella cf. fulva]